jgi:hypothetical protein
MSDEKPKVDCDSKCGEMKVLPVKILSMILVSCGLLCFFFGMGFVIVRVRFQAYSPVLGYHMWCGLIIAVTGALGIASYKKMDKKLMIAAGSMGIVSEVISIILCQFSIRLLFEKVGRTAAWMAEPEAEAAAKAETTVEPELTAAAAEGTAEPETFAPILAHQMDIFLQLSAFLAILYLVSAICGVMLASYTIKPGCSKKVEPEKQPV